MNADVAVIGAGLVGAAIGYGLASRGVDVVVLDGEDRDFRAANANFGLVWLHAKGLEMPAYRHLTRGSVLLWPEFSAELSSATNLDLEYEQTGGLGLCLGEEEFERRRTLMSRLDVGADPDWEMLDHDALSKLLPKARLGPAVTGASFGRRDGHANPLRLLAALHAGIIRRGGRLRGGSVVRSVNADGHGSFAIEFGNERLSAGRVVIAAGLGSKALAAQVGLDVPLRPQRGQILVTERLEPFLPLPMADMRQTRDGTVMMGTTNEEAGFDGSTTVEAAAAISDTALQSIPALSEATLVRQWAGLRILTPDGFPIYAESPRDPGAFVALCHSGVTLAAMHAGLLAEGIAAGRLPSQLDVFHPRRFDVPKAA